MTTGLIDTTIPVLEDDPFSRENLRTPEAFDTKLREMAPLIYLPKYDLYASGRHSVIEDVQVGRSGI